MNTHEHGRGHGNHLTAKQTTVFFESVLKMAETDSILRDTTSFRSLLSALAKVMLSIQQLLEDEETLLYESDLAPHFELIRDLLEQCFEEKRILTGAPTKPTRQMAFRTNTLSALPGNLLN